MKLNCQLFHKFVDIFIKELDIPSGFTICEKYLLSSNIYESHKRFTMLGREMMKTKMNYFSENLNYEQHYVDLKTKIVNFAVLFSLNELFNKNSERSKG